MDSEMLENCHRKSGEGRNNHHKQKGHLQYQSNTDMPEIVIAIPCHHENGRGQKSSARSSTNGGHHSNGGMRNNDAHKIRKQHKEMTLQDMYNFQDTDDDEDSDWEPFENHASSENWFCTNCTMKNWDEFIHCDVCGEHKDSDILTNGSLAPSFTQEATQAQDRSKCKDAKTEKPCMKDCTIVGYDERMLLHSEVEMKDHPHPERPDRLNAILASLAAGGIFPGRCIPIPAREITREELQLVHTPEHVDAVEFTSCMISSYFTPDTYANEHSACAARLAAGLCADLATNIISGQAKNGFALVRPPGHHAGVKESMGFCLHNNAAVAALAAQGAGAKKVLIVDWDVHHGNGTQEIFDASKSVLYISLHRHEGGKFYPGTGAADEVGTSGAEGYCVNIPWECGGVGDRDYMFAFQHVVLPIALEFAPDLTIISAGFDAARGDPLGCCDVTPSGYAQMTQMLMSLSSGKLLVILEGGYNLRAISASATAVIKVLLGESPDCELNVAPTRPGLRTVLDVLEIQTEFWPNLESTQTTLQSQWASYLLQKKKCQPEPTTEIQQQGVHMTNLQNGEGIQATSRSPMSTKKDKGATGVLPDRMSSFPEKMPMVSEKISQQSLVGGQSEEDEQSFEDDKEDDIRSSVIEEGQKREMKERERMVEVKYKKRSDKEKEKRVEEKQNEQREKEGKERRVDEEKERENKRKRKDEEGEEEMRKEKTCLDEKTERVKKKQNEQREKEGKDRRVNEEKERENKRKRKDEEGEEEMRKEKKREDEKTGEQTERRVKATTREERKRKEKEERKRRKKSEEKRTDKEEEVREELDAIRMHKKEDTRKEVKFEKGKKVVEMKEKSFDCDKENAIGLSVIVEPHEREMKEMEGNVEVKYKKRSEKEREKRLKEKQNEKREKEENEQREKKREKEENEQREKEKREKKREKEENKQREKEKRERRGNEEKEMDKRKRTVEDGGGRRKEKEHKDKKKREETTREQERKIKGKEEKKRRKKLKEKRTDDEEKGKEVENDVSRCKEYDTLKEKKIEKVKKVVETRKEKDRKNMNGEKVTKRLDSDAPSFPRCKPLINQPTTVLDPPEGSCI